MLASVRKSSALLALALLTGCGDGEDEFTANVAGSYTIALTNKESSCQLDNWMEGAQAENIDFDITQSGQDLHAVVGGVGGIYVALVLGSAEFDGSVDGNKLALTNYGTRSAMQGNCTFTYNAIVAGTLKSDAISGTITYAPATNENPDCADIECAAVQEFSGSRPPL